MPQSSSYDPVSAMAWQKAAEGLNKTVENHRRHFRELSQEMKLSQLQAQNQNLVNDYNELLSNHKALYNAFENLREDLANTEKQRALEAERKEKAWREAGSEEGLRIEEEERANRAERQLEKTQQQAQSAQQQAKAAEAKTRQARENWQAAEQQAKDARDAHTAHQEDFLARGGRVGWLLEHLRNPDHPIAVVWAQAAEAAVTTRDVGLREWLGERGQAAFYQSLKNVDARTGALDLENAPTDFDPLAPAPESIHGSYQFVWRAMMLAPRADHNETRSLGRLTTLLQEEEEWWAHFHDRSYPGNDPTNPENILNGVTGAPNAAPWNLRLDPVLIDEIQRREGTQASAGLGAAFGASAGAAIVSSWAEKQLCLPPEAGGSRKAGWPPNVAEDAARSAISIAGLGEALYHVHREAVLAPERARLEQAMVELMDTQGEIDMEALRATGEALAAVAPHFDPDQVETVKRAWIADWTNWIIDNLPPERFRSSVNMKRSALGGSGATLDNGGVPVPDLDVPGKERPVYPPIYSLYRLVATLEREDWNTYRTLFGDPEDEARAEAMKEGARVVDTLNLW